MSARPASRDGTSKRSWIPDQVRNDHRSYARLFDWHCNYKRGLGPMQEVRMTSQIVILFKEHGRYGALPYMVSHRIVS